MRAGTFIKTANTGFGAKSRHGIFGFCSSAPGNPALQQPRCCRVGTLRCCCSVFNIPGGESRTRPGGILFLVEIPPRTRSALIKLHARGRRRSEDVLLILPP